MPSSAPPPGGRRAFFIAGRDAAAARSLAGRMGSSTADLNFPLLFPPTLISVTPSSGINLGGTVVDLAGMNFRNGATVTFGGIPATSIVFVSSSHITATTPAHAVGAVNVVVTNPSGQSSTLANGFTYFSLLIPDDASTIFHLYVLNGVISDTQGNVITEVGTVPRVASAPMGFPNGKSAAGLGPFASTNYLTLPAGLLSLSPPFTVTAVLKNVVDAIANSREIINSHTGTNNGNSTGFIVRPTSGAGSWTSPVMTIWGGGVGQAVNILQTWLASSIAVFSHSITGNSGANTNTKKDSNAVQTAPAILTVTPAPGATIPLIGWRLSTFPSVQRAFDGTMYEIRVTTGAMTAAQLDALHTAIFNDP